MSTTPLTSRPRLRRILFLAGPAVGALVGLWALIWGGRFESTDDAYVKSNKVNIGTEISGTIAGVAVRENQQVAVGEVLLTLDPRPFEVAVREAEADVAASRLKVESLKASWRQKRAAADVSRADLAYQKLRFARVSELRRRGIVADADLDQARHDLDVVGHRVNELDQDVAEALAELGGDADMASERHPIYQTAQAALERARLNLARSTLRAPIAGVASKVPEVGAYAMPGLALMSVVAQDEAWVEANFKESELEHLRPGQSVAVRVDSYPDTRWSATVDSIGQATGAEFSLLPAQNATGNWVKVVQRVPVRLRLVHFADEPPLRSGMSARVRVDTGASRFALKLAHFSEGTGVGTAQAAAAEPPKQ